MASYDATEKGDEAVIQEGRGRASGAAFPGGAWERGAGERSNRAKSVRKQTQVKPDLPLFFPQLKAAYHHYQAGELDQAEAVYQEILKKAPDHAEALHRLGLVHHGQARFDRAVHYYHRAIAVNPEMSEAYGNLGNALQALGRPGEAVAAYEKAIERKPDLAEAHNNLGNTWRLWANRDRDPEKYARAIACFQKALSIKPDMAQTYYNLANAYQDQGGWDAAIDAYQKAVAINPRLAEAYNNLGNALKAKNRMDEALAAFKRSLELNPASVEALGNGVLYSLYACDWRAKEAAARLDELTRTTLQKGGRPIEQPLMGLMRHPDPKINYKIANAWSREIARRVAPEQPAFSFDQASTPQKITIGYLSGDFYDHAVTHQFLGVFSRHDRHRFTIRAYSYGPDDNSPYRRQVQADCDGFVDLRHLSNIEAARRIHGDGVDILVDLTGFTRDNRLEIAAMGPAPLQVAYLGFPGTIGGDFFDYLITDPIVSPPEHAPWYGEKFLYLPHCYMAADRDQPVPENRWTRLDFGLPEGAFVFCSFNQPYKFEPVLFETWMNILRRVPDGVLWLYEKSRAMAENLKKEAKAQGIAPERLIFAKKIPGRGKHLSRLLLADLALDTRIYNGHATTCDALWAGVPVVALLGEHFPGRAAASMVSAVGLSELIAKTRQEYEELAVGLAQNRERLERIRQKLIQDRQRHPLFDTPRFVSALERGFEAIHARRAAGNAPETIHIQDIRTSDNHKGSTMSFTPNTDLFDINAELQKAIQYHQAGQYEAAKAIYQRILAQEPNHADALHLSGLVLHQTGQNEPAVKLIQKAIENNGKNPIYYSNLGITLKTMGRISEAIDCYQKSIELNPQNAEAYNSLGNAYKLQGNSEKAVECYQKAIEIKPDYAEIYSNMGNVFQEQGKIDEAIAQYQKSLELKPDNQKAHRSLIHQFRHICQWDQLEALLPQLEQWSQQALEKGTKTAETPFMSLTRKMDPAHNYAIACAWGEDLARPARRLREEFKFEGRRQHPGELITIGYLSNDFRNHAVAGQMLSLFGLHDRRRFRIHCYSYGVNDRSYQRARIQKECDKFVDVREMSHLDAARQIYEDKVDILVDLMGHTTNNRLEISAFKPAPVQIAYLGFPGTTGADFFDYLIADKIVVPPEQAGWYREKLIYLPHTYMVNDHTQPISLKRWKKADFGLSPDQFIFCSLNQPYKIEPVLFDSWMNLLKKVPGSVLWLFKKSDSTAENLKNQARNRGVDPERLLFLDKIPRKDEYLSRLKLADLALDTRIYNGHATTNDALWAGVPVVTLQGEHFPSRAASSFLTALGMTELITRTPEEYEDLALRLATNPGELKQVRQKIALNRLTQPLFDTPRFARNLEKAFETVWERFLQNQPPAQIAVKAADAQADSPEFVVSVPKPDIPQTPAYADGPAQTPPQMGMPAPGAGAAKPPSSGAAPAPDPARQAVAREIKKGFDLHQAGDLDKAQTIYQKVLAVSPRHPDALHLSGLIHHQQGEADQAVDLIRKAIDIYPNSPVYYANLGAALQRQGNADEAIRTYKKVIELKPDYADAYLNLGNIMKSQGEIDEALKYYDQALEYKPEYYGTRLNLGNTLQGIGRIEDAIKCYHKVLEYKPDCAEAYLNLGNAYKSQGKLDDAIAAYEKSLELKPDYAGAYYNIGFAKQDQGKLDEAIEFYEKALELEPENGMAFRSLIHQLRHACSWDKLTPLIPRLREMTDKALEKGTKTAETPFMSLTSDMDPPRNVKIARSWCKEIARPFVHLREKFSFEGRAVPKEKLVIGYLSNDFRNHPVAAQILSLFRFHNRDRFEIRAYSYGKDDGSHYRKQIEKDADEFIELKDTSHVEAARRIHNDGVDILVDLMGHTTSNRLEICAPRPAPVQVAYLGFPGTSGADFFDYLITDKIVTPPEVAPYYTEKLVFMPHCYMINDCTQAIANRNWSRAAFGLPEKAFVFCCMNQAYKIEPVMFDIWMRVMRQVPDSVLWLFKKSETTQRNLRAEAEKRGVDPERLHFTGKLKSKSDHLARLRLVDLALDTRIYNGHATSNDALWAGLPVVTLQGGHFPSRACSSFLNTMGLPELITESEEEYEARILRLAQNPDELAAIKDQIAQKRLHSPLFDTPRFTRNLEKAFEGIWEIYVSGQPPQQFEVIETEADLARRNAPDLYALAYDPGFEIKRAFAYHQAGKGEKAEKIYQEILSHQPDHADALHLSGLAAHQRGENQRAEELIRKAIAQVPQSPVYYHNLSAVLQAQTRFDEAIDAYFELLEHKPDDVGAHQNLARLLIRQQRLDEALDCYQRLASLQPGEASVYYRIGLVLHQQGQADPARIYYQKALSLKPDFAEPRQRLAQLAAAPARPAPGFAPSAPSRPAPSEVQPPPSEVQAPPSEVQPPPSEVQPSPEPRPAEAPSDQTVSVEIFPREAPFDIETELKKAFAFHQAGELDKADELYGIILGVKPTHADALHLSGVAAHQKGEQDRAIDLIQQALKVNPDSPIFYSNLGASLQAKGKISEAVSAYERALSLRPDYPEAQYNLGVALKEQGQTEAAIARYQRAIQLKPDYLEAQINLGIALAEQDKVQEAIGCYQQALKLNPNSAKACYNLAAALESSAARLEEAIGYYRRALRIQPDHPEALRGLAHQLRFACAWEELESLTPRLEALNQAALAKGEKTAEMPIMQVARVADPDQNYQVARSWARDLDRTAGRLGVRFSFAGRDVPKDRLVIGYLSKDFSDHPVGEQALALFARHHREKFEVCAYSYGRDKGGSVRNTIAAECDRFVDIRGMSDVEAARRIYADGVDILVDLNGHTSHNRMAICALRPAPVQISYLGYPGTTGADFFQYILADSLVAPEEQAGCFSEKLIHLPHSYLMGTAPEIAAKTLSKADFGLSEEQVAFCSFNQSYKIDPRTFAVWTELLQKVPGSVLWLMRRVPAAEANLKAQAQQQGVDPARLVFMDRLPEKAEHMARLQVADIALDTRIYNGHVTTADAIWAGVPVITVQGSHFASRVAASILHAAGLPELVTHDLRQYRDLALRLATDPAELSLIRDKINRARQTEPFFDATAFVGHVETAFEKAWERYVAGERPEHIRIPASARPQPEPEPAGFPFEITIAPEEIPPEFDVREALKKAFGFHQAGKLEAAAELYDKILQVDPDHADTLHLSGIIALRENDYDRAESLIRRAIRNAPANPTYLSNLGAALKGKNDLEGAVEAYQEALKLKPDFVEVYYNLAIAFERQKDPARAAQYYQKTLQLKPGYLQAYNGLVSQLQALCAWDQLADLGKKLDLLNQKALETGKRPVEKPPVNLMRYADPAENYDIAKGWSQQVAGAMAEQAVRFSFDERRRPKETLRIGYLADDLANHSRTEQMLSIFRHHRHDQAEVFCYATRMEPENGRQDEVRGLCHRFADLSQMRHADAARRIYEDGVDILVDMMAFRHLQITALRPAPVQVCYPGFSGTTGADFLDYLITDRVATPEEQAIWYSERFIYLPDAFMAADTSQEIPDLGWERSEFGLPETGLVFCCFNRSARISPELFAVWMNLLRQVPDSVLWLLKESETGAENLRQAAKKQGIAPQRLVFSEKLPDKRQHLSRLKLADLALDPWIANGQATTADLLLAGVPVVTLQGTHFPSRAGSSILMAAGLPELIAYSPAGYERIALRLAKQPRLLEGLKAKIAKNQAQKPFFEPARFVAHLEAGYQRVWERFVAGKPVEPIVVDREAGGVDSGLADGAAKKKFQIP